MDTENLMKKMIIIFIIAFIFLTSCQQIRFLENRERIKKRGYIAQLYGLPDNPNKLELFFTSCFIASGCGFDFNMKQRGKYIMFNANCSMLNGECSMCFSLT